MATNDAVNRLLGALSKDDHSLLDASLEPTVLRLRQVLETPCTPVDYVYFPLGGLASVVASNSPRHRIEIAMIGREGMSGISVVLNDDLSANAIMVQSPGKALRIPASALRGAMRASSTLTTVLERYVHSFLVQASYTALANGRGRIEERLARWLVMWHDRVREPVLKVTHDILALLLGVRRQGITLALHALEGRSLIKASRSTIRILDRNGLVSAANGFYGAPEIQYDRMIEVTAASSPEAFSEASPCSIRITRNTVGR